MRVLARATTLMCACTLERPTAVPCAWEAREVRPRGFVCSAVPLPSVARVRVVRAQATPRATSVKSTRLVSLPQVWVGAISVRAAHIKTVRSLLSGQHTVTSRNLRVRFKASILRNTLSTKIRFTHHVRRAVALGRTDVWRYRAGRSPPKPCHAMEPSARGSGTGPALTG